MRSVNLYVGHGTKILGPGGYIESSYDLAAANPPPGVRQSPGYCARHILLSTLRVLFT